MENSRSSMPPSMTAQQFSLDERHRYYIVRPDHTMVPLIPADQLPFQLQDIPFRLTYPQMSTGKWKFLAETSETPVPLSIVSSSLSPRHPQTPPKSLISTSVAPDFRVRNSRSEIPSLSPTDLGIVDIVSKDTNPSIEPRHVINRTFPHSPEAQVS